MANLVELFVDSSSTREFVDGYFDYLAALAKTLDGSAIAAVVDIFIDAADAGHTIYFIGNGGAAATAAHWANDMGIGTRGGGEPWLKAVSLADNISVITALANDYGYEEIFVRQLQNLLQPDDVVMAFSVSGNSENVIKGIEYANELGARTIGFTGFDGGRLKELVDLSLHVPTPKGEYGPVEDLFQVVDHLVGSYLMLKRHGRLGHG